MDENQKTPPQKPKSDKKLKLDLSEALNQGSSDDDDIIELKDEITPPTTPKMAEIDRDDQVKEDMQVDEPAADTTIGPSAFGKGADACVIESAKAAADLILPISGEIVEINEVLADQPELINSSPFNEGWLIKIKISNPSELDELLTVEEYKALVSKELENSK